MQAFSQQDKISDQKDWEWLNLFYQGDATLKSNLIKFYNLLEDPKKPRRH
jgi:hypothetical protein